MRSVQISLPSGFELHSGKAPEWLAAGMRITVSVSWLPVCFSWFLWNLWKRNTWTSQDRQTANSPYPQNSRCPAACSWWRTYTVLSLVHSRSEWPIPTMEAAVKTDISVSRTVPRGFFCALHARFLFSCLLLLSSFCSSCTLLLSMFPF